MQSKEDGFTGLAGLAKENFLDTAHRKIFCCARADSKKAEFVHFENQKIIYGCDKHVLIINISTWNHALCTREELLE